MCENLKADRIRCEACRTINLAKHVKYPKPDMQIYEKCSPAQRVDCCQIPELPIHPTCIKVCSKEEYKLRKSGKNVAVPKMPPPYAHGKLMFAVKKKENQESILAPAYMLYKEIVTTCFSGVVKMPLLVKCAYMDYLKALEQKEKEAAYERKMKRN